MAIASPNECSFLFGGIGDARNLFATLLGISEYERACEVELKRRYHFTINDVNAATLARNVILLSLLQDSIDSDDASNDIIILATIFYLFCSQIMPSFNLLRLQETIAKILIAFDANTFAFDWIHVGDLDKAKIRKYLRSWQDVCSISKVTANIVRVNDDFNQGQVDMFGSEYTMATQRLSEGKSSQQKDDHSVSPQPSA